MALHKKYMSMELNDVKDDPETFITDLDELTARMKEDPFNKEIPDNSFLIHLLNSLPMENKLAITTEVEKPKYNNKMKKNLGFEENCRICGKYGHKAANWFENKGSKVKNQKKQFNGKCNYCGM